MFDLRILADLNRFVAAELPLQHEQHRESFGLLGLSNYRLARVLSRKGQFSESLNAFRRSAESYLARLRQKEEFHKKGVISSETYEEKVSVTVRRAALVAAFGEGYHYFVNGQLSRALESLTLARVSSPVCEGRRNRLSPLAELSSPCGVEAKMSKLDHFLSDCLAALRDQRPQLAIKEVLDRFISNTDEVKQILSEPRCTCVVHKAKRLSR